MFSFFSLFFLKEKGQNAEREGRTDVRGKASMIAMEWQEQRKVCREGRKKGGKGVRR